MTRKILAQFLVLMLMTSIISTACSPTKHSIDWTENELAFIQNHPVIRLGIDPKFVPFEFFDENGEYKGITADYLSLISERTGIKFDIVKGLTWPEAYDKALAGEIDVLPAVSRTEERALHFLFSEPYYSFKRVLVTRDNDSGISDIDDLSGLTVAVQRNSSHHSYMLSYPNVHLSLYDSVEAALTAIASGAERVFVGNLATTNYLVRSNALTNLKFIAFEGDKQQALHFAVRKDWPELVSILNKALANITDEEIVAINNNWIDFDADINYGPIIRIILFIGAFLAVVMAVSFYWIIRLRNEVEKRKLIQADLEKAKQEADDANQFKSNFMARMSHEIRTPLNAITGMAYLLKKTDVSLTQRMYIDRISQAANNMLSIINDILDFSKIEAGKVELEITSFSLDQVVQDIVNIVSYKIEEQEIGFKLSKDPLVPNWFFGDAKRIEQVLLNLLNNAAKFTSSGEVSLEIRLIAKEIEKYHLSFSVKDTGIGMTEEQVNKLFLPFTQADTSITRRFGGSGLGLSIAKNLVDMMDGQIRVFSTPGEGSTFIVDLSLSVDKEKEDSYVKTLSSNHFKDIKALVLEKSGASMNLIESYLSAFGIHCELTSSQASAVSMLEATDSKFAKPFDLLILDFDTPFEGGFRFLESLRSNKKLIKMPKVIMLLPMMREDLFDKLNENGVDMGIGKPIIPSILLNGILDIFKLKAVSASQPSEKMDVSPVGLDKTYSVLLVEDNKTNQLIAKSLLQQIGVETILANDGSVAVDLYQQHMHSIDLILMDLHMPVMDGYEAAQEIRKLSPSIPIVAMTADVILGVREKCEQSGIHHYISKPFDPDRFIQMIRNLIVNNGDSPIQDFNALDYKAGLNNVGGSTEIYYQVLNEFFNENQDTNDRLTLAIQEKRFADAAQIVHKVKGSSGSIGAKTLFDLSITLQRGLKEGLEDELQPLKEKFSQVLQQLLEEILQFQESKKLEE